MGLVSRGRNAVLWLDPGSTTGWARAWDGGGFESGEAWFQRAGEIVRAHCRASRNARVGWEQFNITPATYRLKGSSDAIEVIGAARWVAGDMNAVILPPAQRAARMTVTPAVLRRLGWYRPGLGHANDAARHLLAWMIRSGNAPDGVQCVLKEALHDVAKDETAVPMLQGRDVHKLGRPRAGT
jgi:hypothetical protein